MVPDQPEYGIQLPIAQIVISSEFDLRFKPELRLAVRMVDMNVKSKFLTREKIETETASAKNGWAHSTALQPISVARWNSSTPSSKLSRSPASTFLAIDSTVSFDLPMHWLLRSARHSRWDTDATA
jgi:hypothetical protein